MDPALQRCGSLGSGMKAPTKRVAPWEKNLQLDRQKLKKQLEFRTSQTKIAKAQVEEIEHSPHPEPDETTINVAEFPTSRMHSSLGSTDEDDGSSAAVPLSAPASHHGSAGEEQSPAAALAPAVQPDDCNGNSGRMIDVHLDPKKGSLSEEFERANQDRLRVWLIVMVTVLSIAAVVAVWLLLR